MLRSKDRRLTLEHPCRSSTSTLPQPSCQSQQKMQRDRFNRESLFGAKEKGASMDPDDQGHLLGLFRGIKIKGLAGAAVRHVGKVFSLHNVTGEFFGHR